MPLLPQSAPQWLITAGRVVGIVFAAGLLVLWLMLAARPLVARLLRPARPDGLPVLTRPAAWALQFIDGLAVLRSPALLARVLGITALAWAASITEYWLAMRAVGVQLTPAGRGLLRSAPSG